jgi:hypothetical protein
MSRPPWRDPNGDVESEDSGPFGGLADVLEPDSDFDDPDAVTSLRLVGAASIRGGSLRSHVADDVRTPPSVPIQDFAFADTVFARELEDDEPPAPSGPIYLHDPLGNTQCVTPLAFPLPHAGSDADFATRLRVLYAHARHAVRGSAEEMRELWAGTAEIVETVETDYGPRQEPPSFSLFLRRVVALWSCFQWSRADLTRAAMIGGAVFVIAATIGAVSMDFGEAAASSGVRGGRTLDQHTGTKNVVHAKR